MCTDIPAPTNGGVTYSPDTTTPYDFGTMGTYVCNSGFGIVGGASRVCGGDGSSLNGGWSGSAAACEGVGN